MLQPTPTHDAAVEKGHQAAKSSAVWSRGFEFKCCWNDKEIQ